MAFLFIQKRLCKFTFPRFSGSIKLSKKSDEFFVKIVLGKKHNDFCRTVIEFHISSFY